MKCCDKCKCKCPPKKVDFTIIIPEGIEIGDVEVYQVASDGKAVNEFILIGTLTKKIQIISQVSTLMTRTHMKVYLLQTRRNKNYGTN